MRNKIIILTGFFSMLFVSFILGGCKSSEPVNINEVLQLDQANRIYTAYNIWYEKPENVSSLNYLSGKILQFGSEIKDLAAKDDIITFTDVATGQKFTINYMKNQQMIPIEKFLKRLFTTEYPSASVMGVSPSFYNKIKEGIVEEGMTKKEVIAAYGYPSAHRTPSMREDTWIYWIIPMDSRRIVFKDDKVIAIIKL